MVTLAVPVYNMEQYLPRCMESLLHQTHPEYEILLIDDGSTDSSSTMCDSYAARYPELVRVVHKSNGGLSSARNAGIDAARGEWIVFPDPDDWIEPDYVEAFLSFQRQYQADLVCLGHYVDTDTTSMAAGADQAPHLILGKECQRSILLGPSFQGFSWNKIYRLDIIREQCLRFPARMGTTEDLYFTYQYLAHCGRVLYAAGKRVYHYYQRDNSTTRSGYTPQKLESIRTYELIIADCSERDPELAQAAKDEVCTLAVNLIWLLANSDHKDPAAMSFLRKSVLSMLPGYLRSRIYGIGRKVQAILALVSPRFFALLKNTVRRTKVPAARRKRTK